MRETWVPSLGCEDPLEKGKTTHSSVWAWRMSVHGVAKSRTQHVNLILSLILSLSKGNRPQTQVYSDPHAGTEDSAPVLPSRMLVMIPFSFVPCVSFNRKKRLAQLYQQTTCFSLLWQIYSLNFFFHYKYYCHLAALMQVNTALETQDDFQVGYFYSCFLYI